MGLGVGGQVGCFFLKEGDLEVLELSLARSYVAQGLLLCCFLDKMNWIYRIF